MLRRRIIGWATVLVLALALARPATAGPLSGAAERTAGESLSRLWAEARAWITAVLWHGSSIDPNGAASDPDRGSYIDPDG